ncbi:MAG: DNA primase [Bacteroidales bacterium]|nr:DNA primase [Bacteroidales bacterium]MCF8386945.1 DNA primase [Bacteroidales bacterium]MCF8397440.1 DNA primase [Bacteroidales bacterium]
MITKETIQEIYDVARVEEVVGDFVNLKKRGVNYIGLCPFHNEKTPSFTVSPSKGIYKCFGCGKGGNAVNFVMEHEHYSYPEALKYLADKYNIEIEEEEQTPEQLEQLNEQESLYNISAYAQKYFSKLLFENEEGRAVGLSYLKERDYNEETIKTFQLGYCLDQWEDFTSHAQKNGYKLEFLEKSGLTIVKEDKKFDRFRGRVMFPIHNLTGKVIGFGGRILSSDKSKAKYVNSPESEIYNKSKSLYGIYFARNEIVKQDNCFLVEGYTDVISLYQAGIRNVVASSGTSLTEEQVKLIKRYTPNITILYDGDEAGLKASFRGIDMILEQGMNVKIVLFPEGEDPDSYVRSHRTAETEEFIDQQARDFISFKTGLLSKDAGTDPIKKANVVKEIVKSISRIPDGIYRNFYVKECSSMLDVPEQTLMNELNKNLREKFRQKSRKEETVEVPEAAEYTSEEQITVDPTDTSFQEKEVIRLLLNYGTQEISFEQEDELGRKEEVPVKVAEFIVSDILRDEIEFRDPVYQKIFDEFVQFHEKGEIPEEKHFISFEDKDVSSAAVNLISEPYELSSNWEKHKIYVTTEKDILKNAVSSCILSFKARKVDNLILDIQDKIKESKDDDEMKELLQMQLNLKKVSIEINHQLSRIITK